MRFICTKVELNQNTTEIVVNLSNTRHDFLKVTLPKGFAVDFVVGREYDINIETVKATE